MTQKLCFHQLLPYWQLQPKVLLLRKMSPLQSTKVKFKLIQQNNKTNKTWNNSLTLKMSSKKWKMPTKWSRTAMKAESIALWLKNGDVNADLEPAEEMQNSKRSVNLSKRRSLLSEKKEEKSVQK